MKVKLSSWKNLIGFLISSNIFFTHFAHSKKPCNKRLQATWRLECELGIISDSDCPIDGGWSPWASWSACQGSCDNVGHRKRVRECINPAPSKDGMPCLGLDEQIGTCYITNCSVEDYRKLVEGDAARTEALHQLEAVPVLMERCLQIECPFEAIDAALTTENTWQLNSEALWNALQCVKRDLGCPVSGEWGPWGMWSACGARCGKGLQWRLRRCDMPPPSVSHLICSGSPLQYQECEGDQCAIDEQYSEHSVSGTWSEWGNWSDCSDKCGNGIQRRKRACIEKRISLAAITWGTHCRGQYDQLQVCNNKKCLLNGSWSGWGAWGPCSQTCGAGRRSRSRSCTRPIPSGEGTNCVGPKVEVGSCHLVPCEVYLHTVALFNGDSILQYNFPRKRSTFFHFFIRFMPLSPHGTLVRRGTIQNPRVRLSLHKWHVCLDASGSEKSCSLPRICSPSALEPAVWHSILITVTNENAMLRLNDAQTTILSSFSCDPLLTDDKMNIFVGERLHGEVQEIILNFIPISLFIEQDRRTIQSDFFPSSASNMAYEKASNHEAYLNLLSDQYMRVPCFENQDEWQLELTIKSKTEGGTILFLINKESGNWFYMALQNMRLKIKYTHNEFKSEAASSTECLQDQWLDITVTKKIETSTIETSINAGERLHVLFAEDTERERRESKSQINDLNNKSIFSLQNTTNKKQNCHNKNNNKENKICNDEFFIGGIPFDIKSNITEDFTPFIGTIASLRINNVLVDLHGITVERHKDKNVQVSSRTASISGSYHETAWGESNTLNLTCLHARTARLSNSAYWLHLDTALDNVFKVKSIDNGRVLRLIMTADKNIRGFYTCRAHSKKRTNNIVTYGVLGKIHHQLSGPDSITIIAVCTTVSLVIFTLAWLIIEGFHDIRDGYGFFRDAHLSPEEEAEEVCKYIDQNSHLVGSESAVNIAKARARRRARRLVSRASFGAQEPDGLLKHTREEQEELGECTQSEPESLPALPEIKCADVEPSHEIYRCEPSYVSSPLHGSNITSIGPKLSSSSSLDTSPRVLCSRLLMSKYKFSSKDSFSKKKIAREDILKRKNRSQLFTIKSSTLVNKSPVQKVLQKFQELKSDDS